MIVHGLVQIIKSSRVERSLIPVSFIFLISGIARTINKDIFILTLCCILLYASGGILNAKEDKDFKIKNAKGIIIGLVILTFLISLYNPLIFITVVMWTILSIIYNKYSRKILFADSILLSLTHGVIPIISASLLVNMNTLYAAKISMFVFIILALIIPMKNLSGSQKDKKRKYKTLITTSKNGKKITVFLSFIHFLFLFLAYFIFSLQEKYLWIFFVIIIIYGLIFYSCEHKNELLAYKLSRLIVLVFSFGFVFNHAPDIISAAPNFATIVIYLSYLLGGR